MSGFKPVHRDDLDMDVMAGIEAELKKLHPGATIRCAGDGPMGEKLLAAMDAVKKAHDDSFQNGTCLDCGAEMPTWPRTKEEVENWIDDWRPPEGWRSFNQGDEIIAWQCPACDAAEEPTP